MLASYLEQMRAHVDEGGQLSHRNGIDRLAEVDRLRLAQQEDQPNFRDERFEEKIKNPEYAIQAARSWRRHALRMAGEINELQEAALAPGNGAVEATDFERTLCLSVVVTINELATVGKITNDEALEITNLALRRIEERRMTAPSPAARDPVTVEADISLRGEIADAIRDFCHTLSPAAVQDSHGTNRIYYSGIPLDGLVDAIFAAISPVTSTDRGGER